MTFSGKGSLKKQRQNKRVVDTIDPFQNTFLTIPVLRFFKNKTAVDNLELKRDYFSIAGSFLSHLNYNMIQSSFYRVLNDEVHWSFRFLLKKVQRSLDLQKLKCFKRLCRPSLVRTFSLSFFQGEIFPVPSAFA